jgi:hygromycin-B 4-O-kinase
VEAVKTAIAPEEAAQAMRGLLGRISHWTPLAEGEVSQAFAFRADDRDLVVRIAPRREGFDKDAWAARRLRDTPVPVPEVIHIGPIGEGAYCCVSERVGGAHLTESDAAHQQRMAPVVRALIEDIAAVDLTGSTGFGSFDPATERGLAPTWAAQLRALLPADWDALGHPGDVAMAEELTASAMGVAEGLPEVRKLIHGDLGPDNFTVEGDRIAGVFDWEAVMFGDPLWELARYVLWAPVMPSTRIQADHDLDLVAGEPGIEERLRCLVVVNGLWALDFYRKTAQAGPMEFMLNRLNTFRAEPLPVGTGRQDYWMHIGRRRWTTS